MGAGAILDIAKKGRVKAEGWGRWGVSKGGWGARRREQLGKVARIRYGLGLGQCFLACR